MPIPNPHRLARAVGRGHFWPLDRQILFLNHGSFGSCPRPVLAHQQALRQKMENQPIQFLVRDLEDRLDQARAALAKFLHADANNLVFVPNATSGVNTVLRSLRFAPNDELLVTNHEYNACRNALDFAAQMTGAKVIVVQVPFPCKASDDLRAAILERVTRRTRLALLDHVTSQTAVVMPIRALVRDLAKLNIDVLVDGAHAPGMVPLDLRQLGAAYYTGNCHKWLCAPKGAAFLHVRPDRQSRIHPLTISHGANSQRRDRSRFQIEFGWTGTGDPTAMLCVPEAIRQMESRLPGGWPEVMQRNRALTLAARDLLCQTIGVAAPCPDVCVGSMASIPIPDAAHPQTPKSPLYADPLQDLLLKKYRIEVPIIPWPKPPQRLLRISAQLYNRLSDYEHLAASLNAALRHSNSPRA